MSKDSFSNSGYGLFLLNALKLFWVPSPSGEWETQSKPSSLLRSTLNTDPSLPAYLCLKASLSGIRVGRDHGVWEHN